MKAFGTKSCVLPEPPAVVTVMMPVAAVAGTLNVIEVLETLVRLVVVTAPIRTEVAPVKPDPVSVTVVPAGPLVGL